MACNEKLIFVIGDVLPTIYDEAISKFNIAANPASDKNCECIKAYVASLAEVWIKAFGVKHVLSQRLVGEGVQTIVNHCNNKVYLEHTRTKPKKKKLLL